MTYFRQSKTLMKWIYFVLHKSQWKIYKVRPRLPPEELQVPAHTSSPAVVNRVSSTCPFKSHQPRLLSISKWMSSRHQSSTHPSQKLSKIRVHASNLILWTLGKQLWWNSCQWTLACKECDREAVNGVKPSIDRQKWVDSLQKKWKTFLKA